MFSKNDLTKAYLQVKLDDESQKYLTINTSKGLNNLQECGMESTLQLKYFRDLLKMAFQIPHT